MWWMYLNKLYKTVKSFTTLFIFPFLFLEIIGIDYISKQKFNSTWTQYVELKSIYKFRKQFIE